MSARICLLLLLSFVFLPTFACSGGSAPRANAAVITLTRDVCYGLCPSYTVTIKSDGSVFYEGRKYVQIQGQRTAHIDPEAVTALVRQFDAAGFFSMNDQYRCQATDLPTFTTTLTSRGKTKTVVDYGGRISGLPCPGTPVTLLDLEDQIDVVAGATQWVRHP